MFSQNGKISDRQLFRMIIVGSLGPSLLICPKLLSGLGSMGFIVYLAAAVLSVGYIFLMYHLRRKRSESLLGNMAEGFFRTIGVARLFLVAAGGLYIVTDVVSRIMLPRTNELMVLLLIGALLVYWMESGIESMGRAMELLFYWVLVPIVISLVVALPYVRLENMGLLNKNFESLASLTANYEGMILFNGVGSSGVIIYFIKIVLIIWFIFTPAELVWLFKGSFDDKKMNGAIWKGFGFFWIANILCYGIVLGIYGVDGLKGSDTYPLIKVMQISGVPGDFLRRVDGFMGAFLVVSIFCGICLALVILRKGIASGVKTVRDIKVAGDAKHKRDKKVVKLFSYGIVGVVILTVILLKGKTVYRDKEVFAGVELERRGFVMSIIMEEKNITFEIATDEEEAWQGSSEFVTLPTGDLKEAEELYKENGEKVLDFSHMKILFVESVKKKAGEKGHEELSVANENRYVENYRENIEYMYNEERFGENILVCKLEGDIRKMTADAMKDEKALAVKIENILKSSGKDKELEVYKVYRGLVN